MDLGEASFVVVGGKPATSDPAISGYHRVYARRTASGIAHQIGGRSSKMNALPMFLATQPSVRRFMA
jgi:hypothetical protein